MSMAHDYHPHHLKKDISTSSSVPNLEAGDGMSPHGIGLSAYHPAKHSPGIGHAHHRWALNLKEILLSFNALFFGRCTSRQHISSQQNDDLSMPPYPYPQAQLQGHRSRSVPSIAVAMDAYASQPSLYGPGDGAFSYGFNPQGHHFSENYFGDDMFSTFRY